MRVIVSCSAVAVAVAACGLGIRGELDADATTDAGTDAALDDARIEDAPTDAGDAGAVGYTPVVIATGGDAGAPTGNAQQTHLVYAEHGKRWWLFTIDNAAPTVLATYSSTDFVTWMPGAPLTLPLGHGGHGGNFSVAYADLGGQDVVHLAISLEAATNDRRHYHARAVINLAAIAWGAPAQVDLITDPSPPNPDGCSAVVTSGGVVIDTTGWAPYGGGASYTGNEEAFVGLSPDDGTSWDASFGPRQDVGAVSKYSNARLAMPLASGDALLFWETADVEPDPTNVRWSRMSAAGVASAPGDVFAAAAQGWNDWSAARLSDTDVHAVRRQTTGAFDHRRWDGATWNDGSAIPALMTATDRGVVVLHDASRVMLVAISSDADANTAVMATTWVSGGSSDAGTDAGTGTWTAWAPIVATPAQRTNPSGFTSPTAGSAIIWTETEGGASRVVGQRIAFDP